MSDAGVKPAGARRSRRGPSCSRCGARVEVHLRQHNAGFCRSCFILFFRRQVERAIEHDRMFTRADTVLVAVSGGKDSLALWDVLAELGYRTHGLHLALGIGEYSAISTERTRTFAAARNLPLIEVKLAGQSSDLSVPTVAAATHRPPCSACGVLKRHFFDRVAIERGFRILATGHNLDDEAARLLGNVLHWQADHLLKQRPVLEESAEHAVRKVRPLWRCGEYESAVYAFLRGIDYVVDECPNSAGATQLIYKDALNQIEAASPGTKLNFVQGFLRRGAAALDGTANTPPQRCHGCGMPAHGEWCSYCRLVREVENERARRSVADRADGTLARQQVR